MEAPTRSGWPLFRTTISTLHSGNTASIKATMYSRYFGSPDTKTIFSITILSSEPTPPVFAIAAEGGMSDPSTFQVNVRFTSPVDTSQYPAHVKSLFENH